MKTILSLLMLLALISGCASAPISGRKQLMLVPESQMDQMGNQAFAQQLQQTPNIPSGPIVDYTKCVVQPITDVTASKHDGPKDWRLAVLKDPTPNAWALPGGNIGVHAGIFTVAKNDAQLATVLAHELGHVIAHHGAERASDTLVAQGGLGLVGAFLSGRLDATKSNMLMSALGLGAQVGVLLPFSRDQESEADVIGLHLMAEAGYDPNESVKLWQNMIAASQGKEPPAFLSDHPASADRITRLQEEIPKVMSDYNAAKQGRNVASQKCQRPSDSDLLGR